jgi:hypothetical protein
MNPLAALKEKMIVKPKIEEKEQVAIVIKGIKKQRKVGEKKKVVKPSKKEGKDEENDQEPVFEEELEEVEEPDEKAEPLIVDETEIGFDYQSYLNKLKENKKLKVTIKPILEVSEEKMVSVPVPLPEPPKKPKKIQGKKPLLIIEEDEEEELGKVEELGKAEESLVLKVQAPKKQKRKTAKVEKGVAVLGPEVFVEIGDTDLRDRLPKKLPPVIVKVSSYYMNDREIFVNFINSLFEPYRKELQENKESISCDTIGKTSTNFSLLTHQKIVRDYMNLYTPYRGLLLYHGLGSGKCHAKDTPIMMSDGHIKLVQDIQVGDFLMGDDSKPRKVISLARGKDKMYDIIPIKGEKYRVNQEHILCLRASGFPKICRNNHTSNTNYNVQWIEKNMFQSKTYTFSNIKENEIQMKEEADRFYETILNNDETNNNVIEISVKDYLKLSDKKKGFLKGYKVPIDFPEKSLSIDPYMIGYWLGDGSSSTSEITSQDSTVLYYFAKNLPQYNLFLTHRHKYTYGITGNGKYYNNIFLNTLKDLDLVNNKHIPYIYKCNTRENRLRLLAGLLDSDGSLNKERNGFEFTQKNEKLMDDVIYLARSLGFSCYKSEKTTSWTYKGIKNYGKAFRISINGSGLEEIPTQIPRKQANSRKQIKDYLVTGINVEYVNEDDYYGFMIDQNCRYVMGDFTVTHNTATSIAIAEGMKDSKRVIVMTPASLRANYIEELKKAGDLLYKRNQYWEWISITDHPEALTPISAILNLPMEYIRRHGGAFFVNITKPSNYDMLPDVDKKVLEEQLNEMIRHKYTFINYNGLRAKKLAELTSNFTRNIFDNAVVIIDEAHNLISRIVNKLKKEKEIPGEEKKKKDKVKEGEKKAELEEDESLFGEHTPLNLATKLYYMLLRAQNSRIVLLSGTPIINYPNEFAILFNILRGYIKTWKFSLVIKTKNKVDKDTLQAMLIGEKTLDYLDYSPSSKVLTITRNPFGFKNKIKMDSGYQGVTNNKKEKDGTTTFETEFSSDEDFERKIISILRRNDIDVIPDGIKVINKKALPDDLNSFLSRYINVSDHTLKNVDALKRRIIGLSSFFKSAQESLLPRYNKQLGLDYHIVRIPMSDYQFKIYEGARKEERLTEKPKRAPGPDDLFKESSSTYRIFSRLFCNFVMPERPTPKTIKIEKSFERLKDEMGIEIAFLKLKEQMKPTLDPILDKIPDQGEKRDWEIKIDNELRSYVKDVINAEKKGKKVSNKKLMNIIKDLQKVEEIMTKTKKPKKHNEEEIENIGKRLEAFDLEQALLETGEKPEEEKVDQESENTIVALLKEARKEERRQDVDDENEGEIEGDQVLDKIGGVDYKERLERAIKNIETHSNDFLTPEALETYSPKFLHILENIQDPEYIGLHLVYSQFRTAEGIGLFSSVLKKNGFARFNIKKNSAGVWEIDIPEIDEGKPTFALYTGTETSEEKEMLRHIYNGEWDDIPDSIGAVLKSKFHNNNMGEVIKVFMITSSGSEGINLRNTRYVHIMEPYWHPVRSEQVIGRARRICSHKDLPLALQTVEVFIYIMIFSEAQLKSDEAIELKRKDLSKALPPVPQTSDQYLYEISEIKANLTKQLTDSIKETAFDCYIYSNGKCINFGDPSNDKFAYVPDFAEQQNDTTVQANKKRIEWVGKPVNINNVDYIYRRVNADVLDLYDKAIYERAMEDPTVEPLKVGTYERNERGENVLKLLVV